MEAFVNTSQSIKIHSAGAISIPADGFSNNYLTGTLIYVTMLSGSARFDGMTIAFAAGMAGFFCTSIDQISFQSCNLMYGKFQNS